MLACPHLLSFVRPISAFEQDVANRLVSMATRALVCVGFLDGVEICPETDLARTHLCDHRANRSVYARVRGEYAFARPDSEFEEFSSLFGLFP